ncbi:MAG: hypothetical protein JJT89_02495 [Nitriliruptoraceae bacterium]|nr:hypothetical protein [Nitriliruptoraceae bacterium]
MDLLQTWTVVGVPGLVLAMGLFVGRSMLRAWLGYAALLVLIVIFVLTPGGGLSAAAVGLIAMVLVANGRGTRTDAVYQEHHEQRGRLTTAAGD